MTNNQQRLLDACAAAGLQGPGDVLKLLEKAEQADRALVDMRALACTHVRNTRTGATADAMVSAVQRMTYGELRSLLTEKPGAGNPPQADVPASPSPSKRGVSAWDQLTPAQRAHGARLVGKKPEAQEAFAREFLGQAAPQEQPAEATPGGSQWDRLTPAQKEHAGRMGVKTPEAREAFAAEVLGSR